MKIEHPIEVKNVSHFVDLINKNHPDKTVYRGHQLESHRLVPSMGRFPHVHGSANFEWRKYYGDLLQNFKNEFEAFTNKAAIENIELFAIAQHHGMITNLLDWSRNPLVALYFSVSHILHTGAEDKESSVVWALKDYQEFYPAPQAKFLDSQKVVVIFPKHLSERFVAQKGCFTEHDLPAKNGYFSPLEEVEKDSTLVKYVIPPRIKKAIRIQLNNIGINEASLFPDLGGVCRHLTWKMTNTNFPQVVGGSRVGSPLG